MDMGLPSSVGSDAKNTSHAWNAGNPVSLSASLTLRAVKIGKQAGLKYVYSGNVPGDEGENTKCFNCGNLLIERCGFRIVSIKLTGNKCSKCGTELEGVFSETPVAEMK